MTKPLMAYVRGQDLVCKSESVGLMIENARLSLHPRLQTKGEDSNLIKVVKVDWPLQFQIP